MSPSKKTAEPVRLTKKQVLGKWRRLSPVQRPGQEVSRNMRTIPSDHVGSTFAQDGIRLTGSREFIDANLRILKSLLRRETSRQRLDVKYQESVDRDTGKPTGSWVCYIQVRGKKPRK